MNWRSVAVIVFLTVSAGCGLTVGQKTQVSTFATATSTAVDLTTKEITDVRSQFIQARKWRVMYGGLTLSEAKDLDGALDADKVAQQVATMDMLKDYAKALEALASSNQADAISKAVAHLGTSVQSVDKALQKSSPFSNEQVKAASGIATTISGWYIEEKKKEAIRKLVQTYEEPIAKLASSMSQDTELIGNSPCWSKFREGETGDSVPVTSKTTSGTLDYYCSEASSLRTRLKQILQCPDKPKPDQTGDFCIGATADFRDRARTTLLTVNQNMDDIAEFSRKSTSQISKMAEANKALGEVLENDSYTASEIQEYAAEIKELVAMVEVLTGKE